MSVEVAIVGAGLVGTLLALFLRRKSFTVKIYESRQDPRLPGNFEGRSINLTLSKRGLDALEKVGLRQKVLDNCVRVHSRFVHKRDGTTVKWKYGSNSDFLYSISRQRLNDLLLDEAEQSRVQFFFQHRVTKCDVERGALTIINTGVKSPQEEQVSANLVVGCDGAHSTVREVGFKHDRCTRFRCQQSYISFGYKEFHMPANYCGGFAFDKNYLHVWPRQDCVLLGLPNEDKTLTTTLFMSFDKFEEVGKDQEKIVKLFREEFPGITALLGGEHKLVEQYQSTEPGSMISITCGPHHRGRALLLGDAAHAMVPFYGQGVNTGFEDCMIFDEQLGLTSNLVEAAKQYSSARKKDVDAMVALSLHNFEKLLGSGSRRSLTDWIGENVVNSVSRCTGGLVRPLYQMVAFSNMRHSEVVKRHKRQQEFIAKAWRLILVLIIALVVCIAAPFETVLAAVLTASVLIVTYIVFTPQFNFNPSNLL